MRRGKNPRRFVKESVPAATTQAEAKTDDLLPNGWNRPLTVRFNQANPVDLKANQVRSLQMSMGNSVTARLLAKPARVQRQEEPAGEPEREAEEAAAEVTEEDRNEFGHLRSRTARSDNTRMNTVEDYVAYRDSHFGGRANYEAIRAIADAEWNAHRQIRSRVGQSNDSPERRKALYRWLRLEYRREGIDTADDIVNLMRQGMTPELQEIVTRVRAAHPSLRTGGFVARPKKNTTVGYRLGTLSEHGTGKAFDVRPQTDNPQIPSSAWRFIERLTGRNVDRSLRRWQNNPGDLWQDISNINDEFRATVVRREAEIRAEREAAGTNPDNPPPLNEVLAGAAWLRRRASRHGLAFFTLNRDVVMAMHAEGLIWGATFPTPDLHHFEMP